MFSLGNTLVKQYVFFKKDHMESEVTTARSHPPKAKLAFFSLAFLVVLGGVLFSVLGTGRKTSVAPTVGNLASAGNCSYGFSITPPPTPTPTPTTPIVTPTPLITPTPPAGQGVLQSVVVKQAETLQQSSTLSFGNVTVPAGSNRILLVTVGYMPWGYSGSLGKPQINSGGLNCTNTSSTPFTAGFRLVRLDSVGAGKYQTETWVSVLSAYGANVPASAAFTCNLSLSTGTNKGMIDIISVFGTIANVNQSDPFHTGLNYTGATGSEYTFTGGGGGFYSSVEPATPNVVDSSYQVPSAQTEAGDALVGIFYTSSKFSLATPNILTPLAGVLQEQKISFFPYAGYPDPEKTKLFIGTKTMTAGGDRSVGIRQSDGKVWVGSVLSVNKL